MENFKISFKNHIKHPFSHKMPDGERISIADKKIQVITFSILFGVMTFGIGGVILFYGLSMGHKIQKINDLNRQSDLKKTDITKEDYFPKARKSVLKDSKSHSKPEIQARIEPVAPRDPSNCLLKSVKAGKVDEVRQLLEQGADPSISDEHSPPLHWAAQRGYLEIVKLLIRHSADVNQRGSGGDTPLIFAVGRNQVDVVKYLLMNNADPNLSGECSPPLHLAAQCNFFEMIKLLVEKGAKINEPGEGGWTPLDFARDPVIVGPQDEIIKYLKDKGALSGR